ncbi:MAG: leucine-rich repeat domain-containing protein, partial [Clostridia bacterium]|nr:leucine-rich repeat domain-containing protein [Clostridia bacterium]
MSFLRKSRILCVALIIALIASVIAPIGSFTAFAGEVGTYGDFEYSMSDFEVTITGYVGIEDYLTIPSEINGDPVVAIAESAFYNCDTLVGVVMPESVTMVGTEAFCDCTSLESVDMPGVTVINSYAFGDCYSLREVNMPRIETIYNDSFSYCESLTDILVADDNEYFSTQDGVLLNKSKTVLVLYPSGKSETSYTAPDSVLEIGKNAFFGNETLT